MFKILIALMLSTCLFTIEATQENNKTSTTKKVIIGSVIAVTVVTAAVVAGPLVLPASTVAAIKASATVITAKAVAAGASIKATAVAAVPVVQTVAPIVGGAKISVYIACAIKEEISPTQEQQLKQLLREKSLEKPFEEQLRELAEKPDFC
jgi:hypothetical protein